jgi:hypothetical protein
VTTLGAERPSDELGGAFFRTPADWRSAVCQRAKWEFARLNRKGWLHCRIVSHHDHFPQYASEKLAAAVAAVPTLTSPEPLQDEWRRVLASVETLTRFGHVDICDDCNRADPHGKKAAGAPEYFSFAPHEIAAFITPKLGAGVSVDNAKARATYETIRPALRVISERASVIIEAGKAWWRSLSPDQRDQLIADNAADEQRRAALYGRLATPIEELTP